MDVVIVVAEHQPAGVPRSSGKRVLATGTGPVMVHSNGRALDSVST
jgi:hypothetical protein